MVGIGVDFSETPSTAGGPPPWPGQHSREVLRDVGLTDDDIDALVAAGAVQAPDAFDPAAVPGRR
jgi:crotonobetainyl-CoA:carnitine CoA-transferase CaiB-like acyl-CoA transferase